MLAYLAMMAPRLVELHRVLKPTCRQHLQLPPAEQARQAAPLEAQSLAPPRQGAPRRDQAAERTLRSLMTASAGAQARIGALAEMYSRAGRERTPEESAEMLALMRVQRKRAQQMNALADQYSWDVDMVSRLLAEPSRP
jgi:hypothetical protein